MPVYGRGVNDAADRIAPAGSTRVSLLARAAGEDSFWGNDLGTFSTRATRDLSIRGHHRDLTRIFRLPDTIDEPIIRGGRKDTTDSR